jgi:hypothetical protein
MSGGLAGGEAKAQQSFIDIAFLPAEVSEHMPSFSRMRLPTD